KYLAAVRPFKATATDQVRGYDVLLDELLTLVDSAQHGVIVMPFQGPDVIPARHRRVYPVTIDPENTLKFGRALLAKNFSETRTASEWLSSRLLNTASLNALNPISYEPLHSFDSLRVFLMKGFFQHATQNEDGALRAGIVLRYVFEKVLRPGDKVLIL